MAAAGLPAPAKSVVAKEEPVETKPVVAAKSAAAPAAAEPASAELTAPPDGTGIKKWQQPDGSLFFGERPQPNSKFLGWVKSIGTSGGGGI